MGSQNCYWLKEEILAVIIGSWVFPRGIQDEFPIYASEQNEQGNF